MAIQILSQGAFRYTSPHKSGCSYRRWGSSLGLPPIEFALSSCPVVDFVLPAIYDLQGQPWFLPGREIINTGHVILYLYRDILYTQRSGRTNSLVVRPKRAEDLEPILASRDQHPREFTRNDGHVLPRDPGEWLGSPFQEHFRTDLILLALRITIADRFNGHAITNLSPEGSEFSLNSLAVLLP